MQHSDNLDLAALQAAKQYMRGVAWPTVIFAGGVFAAYLMTVTGTLLGFVPLPLAIPVVAVLTYLSYTVLHEAAHGTISGNDASFRWLNDGLGYIAAWIMMIPLTAHRLEHMAHHRSTNVPDEDPDFAVSAASQSALSLLRAMPRVLWGNYRYYFANRWGRGHRGQDLVLCLEIFLILAPRLALCIAGYWWEGLALFFVAWSIGATLLLYLFAYIVHRPHETVGRYRDTSTFVVSGPLGKVVNWLWVYQNYHSIHHLFPRVPFYRYQELFAEIEPIMVARGAPIHYVGKSGQTVHA